jgi:hypothetical protein
MLEWSQRKNQYGVPYEVADIRLHVGAPVKKAIVERREKIYVVKVVVGPGRAEQTALFNRSDFVGKTEQEKLATFVKFVKTCLAE